MAAAVNFLRSRPIEHLKSPKWIVQHMMPALGFPKRAAAYLPAALHRYCGKGVQVYQSPPQFAAYLRYLAGRKIESYLEIGTLRGGTFITTVEYLSRFHPINDALAVDLKLEPRLENYASINPAVRLYEGDTQEADTMDLLRSRVWDLVLIDGDHSAKGSWSDYMTLRDYARLIAFHDTYNDLYMGVEKAWEMIRSAVPARYIREFHQQDDEVLSMQRRRLFGIGIVDWSGLPPHLNTPVAWSPQSSD